MILKKKSIKRYLLEFAAMLVIGIASFFSIKYFTPERPFSNAQIVSVTNVTGGVMVTATYTEGNCAFRKMSVYEENDGAQSLLKFTSLNESLSNLIKGKATKTVDQKRGNRHFTIKAHIPHIHYSRPDAIVIMADYDCNGVRDRRQFARIPI